MGAYASESELGSCTIATPTVKRIRAIHFFEGRCRPSMVTLKRAVVSILNVISQCPVSAPALLNYLQLVQDLKMHRVQVANRHILKGVL